MTVELTAHSITRAKERLGIHSAQKLTRFASNAWERGLTSESADQSWQRWFMTKKESENIVFRMYNDAYFIFATEKGIPKLITVYPVQKTIGFRFRSGSKEIRGKKRTMSRFMN